MSSIRQKLKRLEAATQKVEAFSAAGGDLKSEAAIPVWMDFMGAFESMAKEFGYELAKPAKKASTVKPGLTPQS